MKSSNNEETKKKLSKLKKELKKKLEGLSGSLAL